MEEDNQDSSGGGWFDTALGGITSLGNTAKPFLGGVLGNDTPAPAAAPAVSYQAPARSSISPMVWIGAAIGAVVLLVVLLKK